MDIAVLFCGKVSMSSLRKLIHPVSKVCMDTIASLLIEKLLDFIRSQSESFLNALDEGPCNTA